jgi:hypothetical protein
LTAQDNLWPKLAKALKTIKTSSPNVTAADIAERAINYQTHFRDATMTSTALANHWGRCASGKSSTPAEQPSQWADRIKDDRPIEERRADWDRQAAKALATRSLWPELTAKK